MACPTKEQVQVHLIFNEMCIWHLDNMHIIFIFPNLANNMPHLRHIQFQKTKEKKNKLEISPARQIIIYAFSSPKLLEIYVSINET